MRSVLEPESRAARCWPLDPGPDRLEMEERGRGGEEGGRVEERGERRGGGEGGREGGEGERGGREGEWRRGGNRSKGTGERTEW